MLVRNCIIIVGDSGLLLKGLHPDIPREQPLSFNTLFSLFFQKLKVKTRTMLRNEINSIRRDISPDDVRSLSILKEPL
jgi:hypothetical protein